MSVSSRVRLACLVMMLAVLGLPNATQHVAARSAVRSLPLSAVPFGPQTPALECIVDTLAE